MAPTGRIAALGALAWIATAAAAVLETQAQLAARQARVGERVPLIVAVTVDDDGKDLPWPEVQLPPGLSIASKDRS